MKIGSGRGRGGGVTRRGLRGGGVKMDVVIAKRWRQFVEIQNVMYVENSAKMTVF